MNAHTSALSASGRFARRTGGGGSPDGRAVDWDVAVSTATRLIRPGPEVSRSEAERTVHGLREASVSAETHVRELTGLGMDLPVRAGDVVDRPGWLRGASRGLAELTDTALADTDPESAGGGLGEFLGDIGSRGAGVQTGLVLAYLGTKVLGQYDPFVPAESGPSGFADAGPGRLLLVAPNIVAAQQALQVPGEDFRMWVCLHESTHRLQFNAVPWLRDHFARSLGDLLTRMDASTGDFLERLPSAVRGLRSSRGDESDTSPGMMGIIELLQSPAQRAAFDRIIAVSTLLEGHADHVMDAVGPRVVPSVHTIRERFTERRAGGGILDRVLRSLLGVDAKIKQYAQGSEFTRQVVDAVGMAGFNAVWTSPEHLPTRAELADPPSWLRRVHG